MELALTGNMCRRIFFHSRVDLDSMYVREGSHCFLDGFLDGGLEWRVVAWTRRPGRQYISKKLDRF